MAKTQVNKTQLIKDALAKNPKASPSEIAEGLIGPSILDETVKPEEPEALLIETPHDGIVQSNPDF